MDEGWRDEESEGEEVEKWSNQEVKAEIEKPFEDSTVEVQISE